LQGSRGKGPSAVVLKAYTRDRGIVKLPSTPTKRHPLNNKRKIPHTTDTKPSADNSANLKKNLKKK
jgi:hypothetical protein